MPSASRTETFEIPKAIFFEAIADFEAYPDIVEHMRDVDILEQDEGYVRAKFTLHYIKEVSYILDLYLDAPGSLSWEFVEGDVFESMEGSWTLKQRGKRKTEVIYDVDVESKIAAPDFIVRRLVAHNLPKMMHAFYDYALELEEDAEE